jgi:hypothetical protein
MARETIQEFRDILLEIKSKIDRNTETINEIKIDLNRIKHDLYGDGRPGLFEEFGKVKPIVYSNQKQIWGIYGLFGVFTIFKDYIINIFINKQ